MFAFPAGIESYQYHLYVPYLYNITGSLNILSFPLYNHITNLWGFEIFLTTAEKVGGMHLVMVSQYFFYLLFFSQIALLCQILFKHLLCTLICINLILFSPHYINLTLYLKPEIAASGFIAVIICMMLVVKEKQSRWLTIASSLMMYVFISLKMTSFFFLPILTLMFFIINKNKYREFFKITFLTLLLSLPLIVFHFCLKNDLAISHASTYTEMATSTLASNDMNFQVFFANLIDYLDGYRPAVYLMIFMPAVLFFSKKKETFLLMILFAYGIYISCALTVSESKFDDQFRYAMHFHFVIHIIVSYLLSLLIKSNKKLMLFIAMIIVSLSIVKTYKLSHFTINKFGNYLIGKEAYAGYQQMNGLIQYETFAKNKKEGDKLLFIGYANYIIRDQEILRFRSKDVTAISNMSNDDFIEYIEENKINWILFANGFNNTMMRIYKDTSWGNVSYFLKQSQMVSQFEQHECKVSTYENKLYHFTKENLEKIKKKRSIE